MPRHISANDDSSNGFVILLTDQQSDHAVDESRLVEAARGVLKDSKFTSAAISLAVVDDPTIHELNRRYLNHDSPTDVLSFVLASEDGHLEGEVVISADTAALAAVEAGWTSEAEQLLYIIHGVLHLVGYDDKTPAGESQMRSEEERYLARFGFDGRHLPPSEARMAGHLASGCTDGEAPQ